MSVVMLSLAFLLHQMSGLRLLRYWNLLRFLLALLFKLFSGFTSPYFFIFSSYSHLYGGDHLHHSIDFRPSVTFSSRVTYGSGALTCSCTCLIYLLPLRTIVQTINSCILTCPCIVAFFLVDCAFQFCILATKRMACSPPLLDHLSSFQLFSVGQVDVEGASHNPPSPVLVIVMNQELKEPLMCNNPIVLKKPSSFSPLIFIFFLI